MKETGEAGKRVERLRPSRFGQLGLVTLLSRFLGLARETAKAYFLGVGVVADAFTIAFSIPNLFRRLTAEGATLTSFVPVLAEVEKKLGRESLKTYFAGFTFLYAALLFVFCTLFVVFSQPLSSRVFAPGLSPEGIELTAELAALMFFYLLFISLAALCQGLLNHHGFFVLPALTPILLNLAVIASAWLGSLFFDQVAYGFAIGVLLGGILQLGIQLPKVFRLGFRFCVPRAVQHPYVKRTLKYVVPGIFGAGVYQINVILGNVIASGLGEGSVSALSFSVRLQEFALGVFVISITTLLLPKLSRHLLEGEMETVGNDVREGVLLAGFLTLPIAVFMLWEAESVVRLLFNYGAFGEKSVAMTAVALQGHALGLAFIGFNRIFTAAFQAAKLFRLTVQVATVVMLANVALSYWWGHLVGHRGIAYANSFSQLLQTVIAIGLLTKIMRISVLGGGFALAFGKFALATLALSLVLYAFRFAEISSVWILFPKIALAGSVYLAVCKGLRCNELDFFLRAFSFKKE